jgi:hypothetical protein
VYCCVVSCRRVVSCLLGCRGVHAALSLATAPLSLGCWCDWRRSVADDFNLMVETSGFNLSSEESVHLEQMAP